MIAHPVDVTIFVGEQWSAIPAFPLYQASTWGRIKNIATNHILAPQPITSRYSRTKYMQVRLQKTPGDDGITKSVHRLVCSAWAEWVHNSQFADSMTVSHQNNDKRDNHIRNLSYLPLEENRQKAMREGLGGGRAGSHRFSDLQIEDMRRQAVAGLPLKSIAAQYKMNRSLLSQIVLGRVRQTSPGPISLPHQTKRFSDDDVYQMRVEKQNGASTKSIQLKYNVKHLSTACHLISGRLRPKAPFPPKIPTK